MTQGTFCQLDSLEKTFHAVRLGAVLFHALCDLFQELDQLSAAVLVEQQRRGKRLPSNKNAQQRRVEQASVPMSTGKMNAVRAAFKAGLKPSQIARQFRISQADVRKALAGDGSATLTSDCLKDQMRGAITAEASDGCAAQPKSKVQKTWTLPEATARHGRLVLRTSGTEPVIRVMHEAYDRVLVDSLVGDVCDAVAQAA